MSTLSVVERLDTYPEKVFCDCLFRYGSDDLVAFANAVIEQNKYPDLVSAAKHAIEFFPLFLKHLKGPLAGKPFELLPWQKKITGDLIGWKRKDGTRQYRTCFIAVPRKNGKSTWLAGLGMYLLAWDNEKSGEVSGAACTRGQAASI